MKQMKYKYLVFSLLVMLITFGGCEEYTFDEKRYSQDEMLISDFLEDNDHLSECYAALRKSSYYNLLNLSGEWTLFAPNNDAFNEYYNKLGVNGLNDLSTEHIDSLFANILIEKKIQSIEFRAGRLAEPNLLGDYLIVNFGSEGLSSIFVNQASLKNIDLNLINGIVHESSEMIGIVDNTLADILENTPGYSIFYEGMVATGIIDSINTKKDAVRSRYTLLIENNTVFNEKGITSFDDLVAKYSNGVDLKDPDDGLNVFFRYHIVDWYLALNDFQSLMYPTVYQYPIVVEALGDYIINRHEEYIENDLGEVIDTIEVSQSLDYLNANMPAWNGIAHELQDVMDTYTILPSTVSFDGGTLKEDPSLIIDQTEGLKDMTFDNATTYFVFKSEKVGDYIEFYGPYLFPVSYYVYMTIPSYNAGITRLGMQINGEKVGESFVNNQGEIFIGIYEVTTPGLCRIKLSVDGDHTNPDKNNIRCDEIRLVPNL